VPVPIASRLVLIPVLPNVTSSTAVNFRGRGVLKNAARASAFPPNHAAPSPQLVRRIKSLRLILWFATGAS
jgi:hypothetical protein